MLVLAALFFGLSSASGVPTVGTETWDVPGGNLNGWTYAVGSPPGGGAQTVDVGALGGHANAVRVLFGDQGAGPSSPEDEKIFANSGNFAGNQDYTVSSAGGVTFSFYAQDYTTPLDTVALFFYSGTSGRTWRYSLAGPATVGAWINYSAPMSWTANWTSPTFGQAEFTADLADVDQIGIWVNRSADTGAQTYALDDFGLIAPEPSTYVILGFTLLTLAITLRRKQPVLVQLAGNN